MQESMTGRHWVLFGVLSSALCLASRGPTLDAALVMQNWPGAVRLGRPLSVEQWHLGPVDRRKSDGAAGLGAHFELHFDSANAGATAIE
jgi:hypothetical protein